MLCLFILDLETAASQPQDVSVSHSFSVVRISQNVKYSSSSDSSATKSEAEKSESETNKSVEAGEASEQDSLAASLLETASADLQNRFFQKKPLSSTTKSPTSTVLSSTLPTATTITSVEKSSKKNTTVTSTKTEAKSEAESEAEISSVVSVASKAKSASEDPHRAPKSIVHPRNPDNRLLLLDRPFHLSATTTQPVIHTSTTTDSQWAIFLPYVFLMNSLKCLDAKNDFIRTCSFPFEQYFRRIFWGDITIIR